MKIYEEDGFDVELAESLSIIVHDECGGCPHDIGIVLALAVRAHYEVAPFDLVNEIGDFE